MRAIRSLALLLIAGLVLTVLPAGSAAAARPAPKGASIQITTDVDPETGREVLLATYVWSGFQGRVVATVTVEQNGVVVGTMQTTTSAGRGGDLTYFLYVEGSGDNTFTATGSLTAVRGAHSAATVLPESTVSTGPVVLPYTVVPCGP